MSEVWRPLSREQEKFLATPAFEAFFGGSAGPGKSECLLMGALEQVHLPDYTGILLRRTFPELQGADGLIERSKRWFNKPPFRGVFSEGKRFWQFPSGAKIFFGHMENTNDFYKYRSAQFQYVGFDELTTFEEIQYLNVIARCRKQKDSKTRCYVRSASNPGGIGHQWVKDRFITSGVRNKIGFFARIDNVDTQVNRNHPDSQSRIFIPATLESNSMIDDEYKRTLMMLDEIERNRLLHGDWDAEYADNVYDNWNEENIDLSAEYNPELPVFWGVDYGYRNPTAIVFAQEQPDGSITIFDEFYKNQLLAEKILEEVLDYPYALPDVVYYDPSAIEFSVQAQIFGLYTVAGYNNVSEGIKFVRRFIQNGEGFRSLKVHPRCKNLIRYLPAYRFGKQDEKPMKEDDHMPDALRYLLATGFAWND